ncbi:CCA tRNA nucleotidyltransferase [Estrella lausannensis]|uniref:Poly ( A) polymerase n=1 Tax=Estrella lausannensis TaxID=483423 RepID=A0A0H5DNQ1_9BACT|nr:CCA tRNA nucleotidyltransferase [Estrella lausannensis]CRX37433.1 Poly (A) polymerase [Estrella lausannensis]
MSHYENAVRIVKTLTGKGHTAYFAGGWVRDHLMGHDSDDIDIATSASPEEILDLFPNTLVVGIAFGVVIVLMEGHAYEVATFRKDMEYENGRSPSRIEWCAPREDALRRDFTINGMFYDPLEQKIYDYVGGVEDIKKRVIKTIGDPYERFREDRLRMVRAFRFSLRFGFPIDRLTQEAIRANADTLFPSVAMERIWQEFQKMAKYEHLDTAFIEMMRLDLLPVIFPTLKGMHLNELKANVSSYKYFPENCSPILYIAHLFPGSKLKDLLELARYLKVSGEDADLLETLSIVRALLRERKGENLVEWVAFFSRKGAEMILQTELAFLPHEERERELAKMKRIVEEYRDHIQRLVDKKPIVTGRMLQDEGLKPGKEMGLLIKEAERIAVMVNAKESREVLAQLKKHPLWPKAKDL